MKKTATGNEELMTDGTVSINEAMGMLGVCRSTIYELMDEGRLGYTRVKTRRRIPRLVIVRYLASNFVEATR